MRRGAFSLVLAAALASGARAAICDGISPTPGSPLAGVLIASGFLRPLFVTAPPGDVSRIFVVEQDGKVKIFEGGQVLATPFLDLSGTIASPADGGGGEQGLLGLAFHPGYATNGWFFVYHTDASGAFNVVERFTRSSANPDVADPATRQLVLTLPPLQSSSHNGGMIAFGPDDGDLYVGTGDGGAGCYPSGNPAQQGASQLGKILRIRVDSLPYTIPPDNPFIASAGYAPEIWSLGLRNPWRWSFDRTNADLYIADVGQSVWEEIDWRPGTSPGGENYGWLPYEGPSCPNASCGDMGSCAIAGYVAPVLAYDHASTGGCAVTGGYVYRGCRMPSLGGTYFYGDYCAAFVKSFGIVGGTVTDPEDHTAELAPGGGVAIDTITSFGEDARGEIYIVDQDGEIFEIVPVLRNMETSGVGAAPLLLSKASWTWEDLYATSHQPIVAYHVYRSSGNGGGTFDCVFSGPVNAWAGGDPATPTPRGLFTYFVTALNAAGEETNGGTRSDGTSRTHSGAACP